MDDIEYRIAKLSLSPGDVLVVAVDRPLDRQTAERMRDHFRSIAPEINRILMVDPSIELSVLTKAEIDARADG
jgi:hypothetical protein